MNLTVFDAECGGECDGVCDGECDCLCGGECDGEAIDEKCFMLLIASSIRELLTPNVIHVSGLGD